MYLILVVCAFMVVIMKTTARAALLLGMVRHMDAISNCAPAVALVTKMIKEAKEAQLTIV